MKMENKNVLTKILAGTGTVLVAIPILAPFLFSFLRLIQSRRFNFDYLMPAELFPLGMAGGALLLWAALRRHAYQGLIGGGISLAIVMLIGGQVLAVVTGLASGRIGPTGWPWALVVGSLILYSLALVAVAVGGVLLLLDLFKPARQT